MVGVGMEIRQLRDDDGEHAALHDLGDQGPPLMLTRGNGLNAGMWATVVPHLRGAFHCFGLDFRGHGPRGRRTSGSRSLATGSPAAPNGSGWTAELFETKSHGPGAR
jgi:pimeloyl-ACP methyl ester carboxylesterase